MSGAATSGPSTSRGAFLILLVAAGGFLGATLRLGVAELVGIAGLPFWQATFTVNAVGCFLMGILLARVSATHQPYWRAFLGFGLLGAFTTFSTFSADVIDLVRSSILGGAAYLLGTVATCLAGVLLGEYIGRRRPR